eukprot:TRINITY_DN1514_c0_g1_i1.p1 TRINITY_DN1514_c0_g1~~TRINITY_DN1514_c0_g1_i1.p1  ORF type:complete len:197 (-),score=22.89 TRINITY_DN1514_c0_g1_i1:2-592(-)
MLPVVKVFFIIVLQCIAFGLVSAEPKRPVIAETFQYNELRECNGKSMFNYTWYMDIPAKKGNVVSVAPIVGGIQKYFSLNRYDISFTQHNLFHYFDDEVEPCQGMSNYVPPVARWTYTLEDAKLEYKGTDDYKGHAVDKWYSASWKTELGTKIGDPSTPVYFAEFNGATCYYTVLDWTAGEVDSKMFEIPDQCHGA